MGRSRDIATFLSKTEQDNTSNLALLNTGSNVGLDSAQVTTIATDAGIAVYTALDSLPSTGLSSGDQAWVESSGRLYISNGSGWYNIALVNASPTLTLDQSGTIQLNADTLEIVVTATAADSDDNQAIITFSVESDGNMVGTGTTISQDSSVFTITALSEDSGGVAGNFTLTFKATDQIAVDNESLSFSLAFSNVVDSSAQTLLLMKVTGNSVDNSDITFLDSADATGTSLTLNNSPQGATFSPYRNGGYSTNFDGTSDYLSFTATSDFSLDSDFTIEGWIHPRSIITDTQLPNIIVLGTTQIYLSANNSYLALYDGSADAVKTANDAITLNDWHHFAAVRSGTDTAMFLNGSRVDTKSSDATTYGTSSGTQYIGNFNGATGGGDYDGFLRDLRIVKGTAIYDPTQTTYTMPTEGLTAVSGTSLLTCHLPYIADGSTNDHSLTVAGASTLPFGPYDQEPWAADDHGASVRFNGTSSLKIPSTPTWANFGTNPFTIECWIYRDPDLGNYANATGILNTHRAGVTSGWYFGGSTNNRFVFWSGTNYYSSDNALVPGAWTHIAAVREGTGSNQFKMYANGKLVGTHTESNNISSYTYGPWIGSYDTGGTTWYHTGNITDMRVSHAAEYTAEFTPPTAPLSYTANTKFLMNNKSDANIYDASAARSFITLNDTSSSTTQRKFTTSSAVYFDGTNDDITTYNIGLRGDMTLEGWFYQTAATDNVYKWIFGSSTYGSNPLGLYTYGTALQLWVSSGGPEITGTIAQNTWYHVAVVRSSGTWNVYLNGTSQGTNTTNGTYNFANTTDWRWGTSAVSQGQYDFAGYMQDWRISDTARYTANFTPPTAEFEL